MNLTLELELVHIVLAVILSLSAVVAKIYHSGKSKGQHDESLANLHDKFGALRAEFEEEKQQAAQEHRAIRNEVQIQQGKIDEVSNMVSKLAGKIEILIKKLP